MSQSKCQEVSAEQAQQIMAQESPVILDMRDASSYREGHIEGALLSHDDLVESIIRKKNKAQPLLIYCYHGNSSKDLGALLGSLGFTTYSLTGGFVAWHKLYREAV